MKITPPATPTEERRPCLSGRSYRAATCVGAGLAALISFGNFLLNHPILTPPANNDDIQTTEAKKSTTAGQQNKNDCLAGVSHVRHVRLYSQNDEDGALLQILRCMGGHGKKEYFEFGSESGIEVNTRILRDLYGWKGHLLDGGNENPEIPLHKEFFTPSNIVSLLEKYNVDKELDVLSVDTDYDDFWTTREILLAGYRPRVLINEYNLNFGSSWSVSTVPKPIGEEGKIHWKGDCYFGVSAPALIHLMQAFGYTPVFSNDINLMFVQVKQALELGMMIPSIDRFPGPRAGALHPGCSGRTWKEIDSEIVKSKASDQTLSHTAFAASFSDIVLNEKTYNATKEDDRAWRTFFQLKKSAKE